MKKIIIAIIVILGIAGGYKYVNDKKEAGADTLSPKVNISSTTPKYTLADIAKHSTGSSCWTAVGGYVYDLTSFVSSHPGGDDILKACGKDGTELFQSEDEHEEENAMATLDTLFIGTLAQ